MKMDNGNLGANRLTDLSSVDPEILTMFGRPDFDGDQVYSQVKDCMDRVTRATNLVTQQLSLLSVSTLSGVITSLETLDEVEKKILDLMPQIQLILARIEGLREKLIDPYNRISSSILLLNRLKTTCDLLRKVIRVLNLCKRLQQRTSFDTKTQSGLRDLIKSAQLLKELESVMNSDSNLSRVTEVSKELESVKLVKGLILDKCDAEFKGGINSVEVSTGKIK